MNSFLLQMFSKHFPSDQPQGSATYLPLHAIMCGLPFYKILFYIQVNSVNMLAFHMLKVYRCMSASICTGCLTYNTFFCLRSQLMKNSFHVHEFGTIFHIDIVMLHCWRGREGWGEHMPLSLLSVSIVGQYRVLLLSTCTLTVFI